MPATRLFAAGKLHHFGRGWLTDGVEEYAGREPVVSDQTKVLPGYGDFVRQQGYPEWLPPSMGVGSEYYMVPQVNRRAARAQPAALDG